MIAGAALALLWIVAVVIFQMRSINDIPVRETGFVLMGLFPVALAMLCGYLITQLKRFISAGQTMGGQGQDHRYYDLLLMVRRINRTMGRENDAQAVLDEITQTCLEAFDCQQVSLMLMDDQKQELVVRSAAGIMKESFVGSRQRVGDGVAGKVAESWEPLLLGEKVDREQFRAFQEKPLPITSAMIVPIILRQDLVGILNITKRTRGTQYTRVDLAAAQVFAEIVAVCIRHAQQTDWMRQTIQRLSAASEGTPPSGEIRRSA
jgi:transcriptional regulator with GAF, ATPase, and Fis domain